MVTVFREEGPWAFYRGLPTNLMRVAPACAITFAAYERILSFLTNVRDTVGFPTARELINGRGRGGG